ncbi:MAG: hypothetical protein Q7L07_08075 [Pseudohongiella sp.]|nr:hypothetical protein [Pseudohongiella sp.]
MPIFPSAVAKPCQAAFLRSEKRSKTGKKQGAFFGVFLPKTGDSGASNAGFVCIFAILEVVTFSSKKNPEVAGAKYWGCLTGWRLQPRTSYCSYSKYERGKIFYAWGRSGTAAAKALRIFTTLPPSGAQKKYFPAGPTRKNFPAGRRGTVRCFFVSTCSTRHRFKTQEGAY